MTGFADRDLDDDLSELFSGAPATRAPVTPPASYTPPTFFEPCGKCAGSGQTRWGVCFRCKGTKGKSFKQPADVRARNRMQTNIRREASLNERRAVIAKEAEAFETANPAVIVWLREASHRNTQRGGNWLFPQEMLNNLRQWGHLTENQLAACFRLMAKDVQRKLDTEKRVVSAPSIDIAKIEEAFAKASVALKRPKLHLDAFTIKHAGPNSKNAGALYVTDHTKPDAEGKPEYLGKIVGGKFIATRSCGDERQAAVLLAAADPQAATIRFGRMTGCCGCCGRQLVDPESVARGIGPICAERYGW